MATNEQLKAKLGFFPLTSIVVANMVGAGIFTTSGLLMKDLGNPVIMLLLWIVGGIIAMCGALCYGELGAAFPEAGGEYTFLSRIFHPRLGFLSGWVSFFVGFSAPIASSAIGFSEYITRAFPGLLRLGCFSPELEALMLKKILAITAIIIFTLIHIRGIEFGAKIQNYLTLLKVALIVGLVMLAFAFGQGDITHLAGGRDFVFNLSGWKTIGLSLMWIMFAYSGWNASAYIGSEIKNPVKNLPRSLIAGTGIVIVLYIALNTFYIYALPPEGMEGVISIGGAAAGSLFGKAVETTFSVLISFALFSSLSAFIILGPRIYYAMARDGYFFRFAATIHPRYKVPAKSIMLQALIAIIMVFFGSFDQILTYMGFSLGIFPVFAIFGIFKLRRRQKSKFKVPGFAVVGTFYILITITMLTLSFFERPTESTIALLTVLAGFPMFELFKKLNKNKAVKTVGKI